MRGRLHHRFFAKIARLDTVETAKDPDAAGPLTSGFDDDFKEIIVFDNAGSRTSGRREQAPVFVACNVEVETWDSLTQTATGNDPKNLIRIVVHISELERLRLLDPATGEALIRVNDRLLALYDETCEHVVHAPRSELFATEARPCFGIGTARDLFVFTFQDRATAPRGEAVASGVKLFGDWDKAKKVTGNFAAKLKAAGEKAMLQEAHFFRAKIVEGLREQAPGGKRFKPLSPMTLLIRRATGFAGTKALIRRADLRNSITVKRHGDAVFVGILRSAKGRNGQYLANVAKIHEEGVGPILIPITRKSRAWLHAMARKAGFSFIGKRGGGENSGRLVAILRIPPRPFMSPVFEKYGKPDDVRDRFYNRLVAAMAGELAKLGGDDLGAPREGGEGGGRAAAAGASKAKKAAAGKKAKGPPQAGRDDKGRFLKKK